MADTQPTYVEEPTAYLFTVTLASPGRVQDSAVNIDRDSDFLFTGIIGPTTAGNCTFNFRLPAQRLYSNIEIPNNLIMGTANQPTAIGPPPVYRAGSSGPQVTVTNTSGATNTINILFTGTRRVRTT